MDVVVLVDGLCLLSILVLNDLHADVHVGLTRAEPNVPENNVVLNRILTLWIYISSDFSIAHNLPICVIVL